VTCAFAVATAAILALLWLEIAQMLKHQDRGLMLDGKLDNTRTHQMGKIVVAAADLGRSQSALSCSPSAMIPVLRRLRAIHPNWCAPLAGYPSTTANKLGGEDRTFNRLNGAYGDLFAEIEVYSTDFRLCVGRDLLLYFRGTAEWLLDGSMQPPLIAMLHQ
jgi:hypothetical protein